MIIKLKSFFQNESYMKYLKNSSWMISEYALKITSAIFVSIYVARFIGPENFGLLSYALAIFTIFLAISRLGMEHILVRDLAHHSKDRSAYMSTAFWLMVISAIISIAVLSILIYFFESDTETKIYTLIIAIGLIFQPLLVIDYNFQAQITVKYASIAKSVALAISSIVKIYLVWIQADLMLFAISYVFDHFITALLLVLMHIWRQQNSFLFQFNKNLIRPLLKSALPMTLSAVAAMLYMRTDQIMIKNFLDAEQLGLYSAATKIYEGWVLIACVFSASLLPVIVKFKTETPINYEKKIIRLFSIVFWTSILIAILTTLIGHELITLTFGKAYVSAGIVLAILMFTSAFTAIDCASSRYLMVEGMEKKIAIRTLLALIINVVLNSLLIPIYGIEGAAISTSITIIFSSYLINFMDKDLKQLSRICTNAITLRVNYSDI